MSKLETIPVEVTVYPDRARVTRRGTAELEAGTHRLEIPELTLHLDPDSLRVSAAGTAQARITGTQVQRVYYAETPAGDVRELEAQIEALEDQLSALDAKIASHKSMGARLEDVAGHSELFATSLAALEMDVDAQLEMFERLHAQVAELDVKVLELGVDKRTLERRLEQLKKQLEQLRGARPRQRYAAFVELEMGEAGELTVTLSYVVTRAAWKPLYDLRLSEDLGEAGLEIGYLAQVTQKTGEAWMDVSLSLSTARPALAATLPELQPWYIQPIRPMPELRSSAKLAATRAADMPADDMVLGVAAQDEPVEAQVLDAQVETTGAAVTYHVPGAVTVPPDGEPHKVSVADFILPPELDYVSAPRLVEAAYRRAKVINDSPHTMLPGAANLFAGDEFIGNTRLELTAAGGEILLYLGADDRITVEREMVRREVDKRLIGGKRRVRYGFEIHLENLLPQGVRLEVHDQFPVPRHEEIKVRLEKAAPEPDERAEMNMLMWGLELGAAEKITLRYDFSVEYPGDMTLHGLP
jgi:uncharacterized protein (TIGR02231 family)